MNIIRLSITRPIAVIAAVLMVIMFGAVGLSEIPIQLTPDVRQPVISVETSWPGAAPAEVEREIIDRQEDALRGLDGLQNMSSRARRGNAEVTLEFLPGADMDKSLLLVANRLDRVGGYPDEVDQPRLATSSTDDQSIAWFNILRTPGNERPLDSYGIFLEDVIKDRLERVSGVSRISLWGGTEQEVRITVDPARLAGYELTIPDVLDALRAADVSLSAGDVDEGKRRYQVRVEGRFQTPEDVAAILVRSASGDAGSGLGRVSVGDIATVGLVWPKPTSTRKYKDRPALPFSVIRDPGANVIETMAALRAEVAALNAGAAGRQGLEIIQIYDETVYITSAIDLVIQNIWVGGGLAAIILTLFLRRLGPTLVVSLAIPVSIIGAFVGMAALGRSLNVISLAGLAFSVGMVVDAAIVVLENIYRNREQGRSRAEAAYRGARQVWGAVLVSALTTVLVFVPILTLELEVGQLFRDIAVAISVAVTLSLIVAVTVVPSLARRLLGGMGEEHAKTIHIPVIDPAARAFAGGITRLAGKTVANPVLGLGLVGAVTVVAGLVTWVFLPRLDYLPDGNRNFVFASLSAPAGYNMDTLSEITEGIKERASHLWTDPAPDDGPRIEHFFFVARDGGGFIGATTEVAADAPQLIPALRKAVGEVPGLTAFVVQPSLFGRSIGSGRAIDLMISGPDLTEILPVAARVADRVAQVLPADQGTQVRARPGLELGAPEIRVIPDPVRLRDAGVSARTFATTIDAFNDGVRVAEVSMAGDRIDLILGGPRDYVTETQGIAQLPVVTENGRILPASALGRIEVTAGPTEIRHEERARTIILQIRPSIDLALEDAMALLRAEVIEPMQAEGLPDGVRMRLAGTADKLTQAWDAMIWQLLLALAIVYLVMAILFESFLYPLVILVTVPLASAGAVLALGLLNLFSRQPLDMLTMLGFVILIGIVVNNAILLVHQSLHHMRTDGMPAVDAIAEATSNRIRPIFMSTLTSLFGMMPLVLFPGAGSELYRGLGTVVLGGLALSAILTLVVLPPLMGLVLHAKGRAIGKKSI